MLGQDVWTTPQLFLQEKVTNEILEIVWIGWWTGHQKQEYSE